MTYNDALIDKISMLGMGFMRLPYKDHFSNILVDESIKLVDTAIENGINYFDTAWEYAGGKSEIILGEALKKYKRDSIYIATKFPGYDLGNFGNVEKIFESQLEKLQTDYIDYYLLHNVCEYNIDYYLNDEKYKTIEYLLKQKNQGRIRHLGFSSHARPETLELFLNKYSNKMEFAQIQLNFLDWEFQNAKKKVEILNNNNIPIWVMEPLRGGSLCKFDNDIEEYLKQVAPNQSITSLGFRFLQGIKGINLVLSGMSTAEQILENSKYFSSFDPLSREEKEALSNVANKLMSKSTIGCTKCKYCVEKCKKNLNIPRFIEMYNEHTYSNGGFIVPMELDSMSKNELPNNCLNCKSCEKVCPQGIEITKILKEISTLIKKK